MIDINFYQAISKIKHDIRDGLIPSKDWMFDYLEKNRSKEPILYDIETTNLCNMKCIMCPRGNGLMTRKNQTISIEDFKNIIDQLRPFTYEELNKWDKFCREYYGILPDEMSQNHFFCNVIAKCLTLHGFGDPLLDSTIVEKVQICTDKKISTYFSCNPANIDIEKTKQIMDAGLDYLKYSIDATSDDEIKAIRGRNASFSKAYQDILKVLKIKRDVGYKTIIVITMINIDGLKEAEYSNLQYLFEDKDVYIYLKSENTQWLKGSNLINPAIHWSEFCQFPWSSFAILSNGDCVVCSEDYDGEIKLGSIKENSLKDIWNCNEFKQIRELHIYGNVPNRCAKCDMKAFYKLGE